MAHMGLVQAARELGSYGRGPDTQLAHIAPDEAEFIDFVQGGRRTNPHTGLPEYGLFGKILKAVVRVGAGIGGFMLGGPAGAALASGAATKLTGGSWKQALKAGALSGIGSGVTQGLTGGGWNLTGTNTALSNALNGGQGAASSVGAGSSALSATPSAASQASMAGLPTGAPTGLGASIANAGSANIGTSPGLMTGMQSLAAGPPVGGLGGMLAPIGGYPGAAAGLGGLSNPLTNEGGGGGMPQLSQNNINLNVKPLNRQQRPYTGDPLTAAEQRGGWQFFDEVNPQPQYLADGGEVGGGYFSDQSQSDRDAEWAKALPHWPKEAFGGYPTASLGDVAGIAGGIGKYGMPTGAERLAIQGGAMASKPGLKRIADVLENHGVDFEWTDDGIRAAGEIVDKFGRVGKEFKTFKENTSLKTIRDWLGYADGGAVRHYDIGGAVLGPRQLGAGLGGLGGLRTPGIPSQIESPHFPIPGQQAATARDMSPAAQRAKYRQAAMIGYVNAREGGQINGPGAGKEDLVPAMLSDGEHVFDAATVSDLGDGSNDEGHARLEEIKAEIRRRAGRRNPRKPTSKQGSTRSLVASAMR